MRSILGWTVLGLLLAAGAGAAWAAEPAGGLPSLAWAGALGYTSDGVSPDSGTPGTNFDFRVKYSHSGGKAPAWVRVRIWGPSGELPGSPFGMSSAGGSNYTAGVVYRYATVLAGHGYYRYRFVASDGRYGVRLPEPGTTSGPFVNVASSLNWSGRSGYVSDGVSPDSAPPATRFDFQVKYRDLDGDPAQSVQVHILGPGGTPIAGSPFAMNRITAPDWASGVVFRRGVFLPHPGAYQYRFACFDGYRWMYFPSLGYASGPQVTAGMLTNLFFLHHSTGAGIVNEGEVRSHVAAYNAAHLTSFEFWDHGYNYDGLTDAAGNPTGTNYAIPGDNTDPDGLHYLWTSSNADAVTCRNTILANHGVIAFKSCFPASDIASAAQLQQYKDWYLAMRDFFDTRPDRLFVVMSTPPLHRLATTAANAQRARDFANWLSSAAYLSGHPNVVCFNLFDYLARADDGSASENRLRYEYELSHGSSDSHPNALANATVGPIFAEFLCEAAAAYTPG